MERKYHFHFVSFILVLFALNGLHAQVKAPGEVQNGPVAIVGATAHLGNGEVLESSVVIFDRGKITRVASSEDFDQSLEGHKIISGEGMHLYPGLILPATELGLNEISAVRATLDRSERGNFNPNVRTLIAYNTDSEVIPTMRFNGILLAQIAPSGGVISGQSSIVQLDAWNWQDAAYRPDDGIFLDWPQPYLPPRRSRGETEPRENENYQVYINELQQLFTEAKAYQGQEPVNLKLEALQGLFDGSKSLFIRENSAPEILKSIQLAKSFEIKNIVLVGGLDALKVKDFLKEHQIPVIIGQVHRLPSKDHEDVYGPYRLPYLLHKEGIKVSLGYLGRFTSARNLPFLAGTAAAYGLEKEEALKMITSNTAEILGINDRTGTIEEGKDANLVICAGDLLDMISNKVRYAFIQGREVSLENKQQILYKKYKEKYDSANK